MFIAFEKQNGSREGIEEVIVSKRRFQYEEVRCELLCGLRVCMCVCLSLLLLLSLSASLRAAVPSLSPASLRRETVASPFGVV